jgi:hypothetical protein
MATVTLHIDMIHAVIPLTMAAVILAAAVAGLIPAWWAAVTWGMTAVLIVPPLDAHIAQVKGLLFCLAVLWLLPRIIGPAGTEMAAINQQRAPRVELPGRQRSPGRQWASSERVLAGILTVPTKLWLDHAAN